MNASVKTSIVPWITVRDGEAAVNFYKAAMGAIEVYRLDEPGAGVVVRLAINGAEFWLSDGVDDATNQTPESVGGGTIRMILTTADPDAVFERALKAGASIVFPGGEGHGWRLGRLADPFGLHWEIGYPLNQ